MTTPTPDPPRRRRRVTVTVDLPAALILLLLGAFVLLTGTVAYGFVTKTLDPAIVLGVVSTMFTGLLAGALTASRRKPDEKGRHDQHGAEDPP